MTQRQSCRKKSLENCNYNNISIVQANNSVKNQLAKTELEQADLHTKYIRNTFNHAGNSFKN